MMLHGIDFSHHNDRYPTSGIDFAILKATQGDSYKDPTYAERSRTLECLWGAYHVLQLSSPGDAAREFANYYETVGPLAGGGGIRPVLDLETSQIDQAPSAATLYDDIAEWISLCRYTYTAPIVYRSLRGAKHMRDRGIPYTQQDKLFRGCPLWLAHHRTHNDCMLLPVTPQAMADYLPPYGPEPAIWQWGHPEGIDRNVVISQENWATCKYP